MKITPDDTDEIKKMLKNLNSNDPKIKIFETKIELTPFYWNYTFITSFFPLIGSVYILTQQNELKVNLLCILLIAFFIFTLITQLPFYNTVSIDLTNSCVTISPNFLYRIKAKKRIFKNEDIMHIEYKAVGFWPSYQRYIITATLSDSNQIKLISTNNKDKAQEIISLLSKLI